MRNITIALIIFSILSATVGMFFANGIDYYYEYKANPNYGVKSGQSEELDNLIKDCNKSIHINTVKCIGEYMNNLRFIDSEYRPMGTYDAKTLINEGGGLCRDFARSYMEILNSYKDKDIEVQIIRTDNTNHAIAFASLNDSGWISHCVLDGAFNEVYCYS